MKSCVQFYPRKYFENISRMFKKLYEEEHLTDVTLCCQEGSIKAHKLILSSCSPYFHKIFTENNRDHLILIMHGISYSNLHNLIELIYKGNVEVVPEALTALYDLAGEFDITGISGREEEKPDTVVRGTRFRGLKRVAVDYTDPNDCPLETSDSILSNLETSAENVAEKTYEKVQMIEDTAKTVLELPKLSAWARKQRKFKCEICPSSFKRSSHLSRHQLVHTGERPFACEQCDKAFSRHDKLKHHIRKAHEFGIDPELCTLEITQEDPEQIHSGGSSPLMTPSFVISNVRSEADDSLPPKRGRGRPRKYPVLDKSAIIKRGRGRPRLNSTHPLTKPMGNGENYDITNLPYGDLEYLTMPIQEAAVMEPLVEIKTEKEELSEKIAETNEEIMESIKEEASSEVQSNVGENLPMIGNATIATIGECTISVATH